MTVQREVYVDRRMTPPCDFERLTAEGWGSARGALPTVFIAPSDRLDQDCEVAEARVSRQELREWAEAILHTLGTS